MIERIRYMGNTYFFDPNKNDSYCFDKANVCHVINYTVRDYCGIEYAAEWRVPGSRDKDILYARRMALKLPPWNVSLVGGVSMMSLGGLVEAKRV